MSKKPYELTEEHRAQMGPWRDKWIANARSTKPMDEEDRAAMRVAIRGIYEAVGRKPPLEDRIVFVTSPFVAAFAAGAAAYVWHQRGKGDGSTVEATFAATAEATHLATADATFAATIEATSLATRCDVRVAHSDEVGGTTWDATSHATIPNTPDDESWWCTGHRGCVEAVRAYGDEALKCATLSYRMRQGGNQWSGWAAFLSFFRHVVKLDIDYSQFAHWEAASIHGGPRYMHQEFCIISDRPEILTVDDQGRPHNETGPFCRWRDGISLYAIHGVRMPAWAVLHPEKITVEKIRAEENAEVRRILTERYGIGRYLTDTVAEVVDVDYEGAQKGAAPRALLKDADGRLWLVGTDGSTGRTYYMEAPEGTPTCAKAHVALCGFDEFRIVNKS